MRDIYLVVLCDRHGDDTYRACATKELAQREAAKLMAEYGTRYEWEPEADIDRWFYRHETFDDGPHLHIEPLQLLEGES